MPRIGIGHNRPVTIPVACREAVARLNRKLSALGARLFLHRSDWNSNVTSRIRSLARLTDWTLLKQRRDKGRAAPSEAPAQERHGAPSATVQTAPSDSRPDRNDG
jgi:hypothetical protein